MRAYAGSPSSLGMYPQHESEYKMGPSDSAEHDFSRLMEALA